METEDKILELKKQIRQIISQNLTKEKIVENLWDFYLYNAANVPAFKTHILRNKIKQEFYRKFLGTKYKNYPSITDKMYIQLMTIIQKHTLTILGAMHVETEEDLKTLIFQALLQNVREVKSEVSKILISKYRKEV